MSHTLDSNEFNEKQLVKMSNTHREEIQQLKSDYEKEIAALKVSCPVWQMYNVFFECLFIWQMYDILLCASLFDKISFFCTLKEILCKYMSQRRLEIVKEYSKLKRSSFRTKDFWSFSVFFSMTYMFSFCWNHHSISKHCTTCLFIVLIQISPLSFLFNYVVPTAYPCISCLHLYCLS